MQGFVGRIGWSEGATYKTPQLKNFTTQPFGESISTLNTRKDYRKNKETEKQLRLKKELAEYGASSKPSFNDLLKKYGYIVDVSSSKI